VMKMMLNDLLSRHLQSRNVLHWAIGTIEKVGGIVRFHHSTQAVQCDAVG